MHFHALFYCKKVSYIFLDVLDTKNSNYELSEHGKKLLDVRNIKLESIKELIEDNVQLLLKKNFLKKIIQLTKIDIDTTNIHDVSVSSVSTLCSICDINNIKICINPCGHTFCESCSDKLNKTCFICRRNADSKIKLFLNSLF